MKFESEARLLKPSLLVVVLKGVLDAGTSIELEMELAGYLRDPAITSVILDVPQMTFVSSSGLRVMMLIIKALVPRQGRLYMVGASPQIVGLVKMSGMTKWINMRNSVQECEA